MFIPWCKVIAFFRWHQNETRSPSGVRFHFPDEAEPPSLMHSQTLFFSHQEFHPHGRKASRKPFPRRGLEVHHLPDHPFHFFVSLFKFLSHYGKESYRERRCPGRSRPHHLHQERFQEAVHLPQPLRHLRQHLRAGPQGLRQRHRPPDRRTQHGPQPRRPLHRHRHVPEERQEGRRHPRRAAQEGQERQTTGSTRTAASTTASTSSPSRSSRTPRTRASTPSRSPATSARRA